MQVCGFGMAEIAADSAPLDDCIMTTTTIAVGRDGNRQAGKDKIKVFGRRKCTIVL